MLADKQIRRVPVVDGDEVVGVIAQADVARHLDESTIGETVERRSPRSRSRETAIFADS